MTDENPPAESEMPENTVAEMQPLPEDLVPQDLAIVADVAELNASPNLLEYGRLLIHFNIDTSLKQCQRCRKSANASPDDNNLGRRLAGSALH